jgi:hypothetical protein
VTGAVRPRVPAIGDVGRAFVTAVRRADLMGIVIAVVLAPLITVAVTLALGMTPFGQAWTRFPFAWLSISDILLVALLGLISTAGAVRFVPRSVRPAFEAFTWAGERSLDALRAEIGNDRMPTSADHAAQWLARTPETDANRWMRAEVLLVAGRFDEARATIERMAARTAEERATRADLEATIDLVTGETADLAPLRAALGELSGEARLAAIVALAILETRLAIVAAGDWLAPLTRVRGELGAAADGILWRGYAMRRLRTLVPAMLVVALAFALVKLVIFGSVVPVEAAVR